MKTAKNELDELNLLRRKGERTERRAQQKEDNHWCFLAGSLVAKYLRADLDIPVFKGQDATAKNSTAFAPLENILRYLTTHKEFTTQIAAGERDPPIPSPPNLGTPHFGVQVHIG